MFPGYQDVTDPAVEASSPMHRGIDVTVMDDRVGSVLLRCRISPLEGKVKAYYIMGEDPLQTEADLARVRSGFEAPRLCGGADIFMTKTAGSGGCSVTRHPGRTRGRLYPAIAASSVSARPLRPAAT